MYKFSEKKILGKLLKVKGKHLNTCKKNNIPAYQILERKVTSVVKKGQMKYIEHKNI